ncbi:MAG: ABC transporter ATP-binding protein [Candidatus Heimdallarchaeaceae archaeon]
MSFIEIQDLIKIYQSKETFIRVPALRGIELQVKKGAFISIIGPSGSGKTTLLQILAGMSEPSAGYVRVDDIRIDKLNDTQRAYYRRNHVGTLWQLPSRNLIWQLTILDNVELPMRLLGLPREERVKRAKQLLNDVGLGNRVEHKPSQISGGEVQRAGLAAALAHRPKLLLADEPTGELDTNTAEELLVYFRDLNKNYGITAVMVTHDYSVAAKTNQIIEIVDGRISGYIASRETESFFEMDKVYLDRYGSIQLPRYIIDQLETQKEIKVSMKDGKLILEQND